MLRYANVLYRVHKTPPFFPILNQINRVLAPFYFLDIHFNLILPYCPMSSEWSLSFWFPHQNPVCVSPLPHTCYFHRSSYYWFDHPNNTWWWLQIITLLTAQFSPVSCFLLRLSFGCLAEHLSIFFSGTLKQCSFLAVTDHVSPLRKPKNLKSTWSRIKCLFTALP